MKKLIILVALALFALAGCSNNDAKTEKVADASTQQAPPPAPAATAPADGLWHGTVAETMDSGGYTYVLLDMGQEQKWVAAPATAVAVDDKVVVQPGMPMQNFTSKTLDRTFEVVYFVGGIEADDGHTHAAAPADHATAPATPAGMPAMGGSSGHTTTEVAGVAGVEKVAGGQTVAEVFGNAESLAGQPIKLRARVVKFTPNIMGTNWIHLQDGTGSQGTHDLTVTTSAVAQVGDLVVVEGPLTVDKDFGAGYRYAAIIEDAKVTVE